MTHSAVSLSYCSAACGTALCKLLGGTTWTIRGGQVSFTNDFR